MRVFVTGASGWIGSATVPELLAGGHEVVGLARSDEAAKTLEALGAGVLRGSLDDLDVLRQGADDSDGVIHLAFKHEIAFSGDFEGAAAADRRAVEVMADALEGSDRPFVLASGLLGLAPGKVATEKDGLGAPPEGAPAGPAARLATAQFVLSLADRGIRSSIMRLPPTNHGDGDRGFIATLVDIARASGIAGYVADGSSRWPAVHRLDSAKLFRLAVESAPAGTALHAVAEEGVATREIAESIGRNLNVPVESVPLEQMDEHFFFLGRFLALDCPASSEATRRLLGWEPSRPGLIADMDEGHYFLDSSERTSKY